MIRLSYYSAGAETSQEEWSVLKDKCQPFDEEILGET
jgi:hypothetical protein